MLFATDFGQVTPAKSKSLCEYSRLPLWDNSVHFYLPLRTNQRFKYDEEWGQILSNFTNEGPTENEIDFINSK